MVVFSSSCVTIPTKKASVKYEQVKEAGLEGKELLFEGLVTDNTTKALSGLTPGVFLNIGFPLVPERGPVDDPIGLSRDAHEVLRRINPEIRLWGTNYGIAVERRGWSQTYIAGDSQAACVILYDFRVDVRDVSLGRNGPFGRVPGAQWWVKVLTRQRHGKDGLYILVVTQVHINKDRIGQRFTENHNRVRAARQRGNRPITIPAMPRWFIVEHELGHVEQIRTAFRRVIDNVVRNNRLCNPNRPINRHKALVEQRFTQEWQRLTTSGIGGSHEMSGGYPNNEIEREVRERSWRLWDARNP